ncbi:hypothetical protein [Hymenobacter lapidiphilus]|uniref:hypothetical protein n=1 Tax=Hymenobacter sp. CCM 8763 TaxID=2303334 RepID=UPI00167D819D|nr:hypothetical protein [Hymenobacter sp. CCM 8763]
MPRPTRPSSKPSRSNYEARYRAATNANDAEQQPDALVAALYRFSAEAIGLLGV